MKKIQITFAGLIFIISAHAQNDVDALRYSQTSFGGTARFVSMGGSMGALGGDISTLGVNPAGIAIYRKSEFTISPSFFTQKTSSNYNNINLSNQKSNFNLGNIGLVATINFDDQNNSGWKSINFGIGYNLSNNFNNRINIQGANKTSSIIDTYVADASGNRASNFDLFSTNLAWQTYLINPNTNDSLHYHSVIKNYGELQQKSIEKSGSMGETNISFGGNFKNKIYLGASVGIVDVNYIEQSVYQEIDDKDTIQGFKSLSLTQNLTTKGTGANFKFGVIVKANEWLRIGGAIHTPTTIHLTDYYSSSMNTDVDSGKVYNNASPNGKFNYSVVSPFKAIGSLGFVIEKRALINVDYEYINYAAMQLHSSPEVFTDINNSIRSNYTSTSNLRVGGEIRFDPLAFRLGYALYGSPYNNGQNVNATKTSYTAGIGFRQNNYFIDFAYAFTMYTAYDYLYDPTGLNLNSVKNEYSSSNFMLTLGLKF